MKQDNETRQRLVSSARAEFLEKGYVNASLRNICRNAGVTTGALYFFFKDKADLFESLTKETVDGIFNIMSSHFNSEHALAESGNLEVPQNVESTNDMSDSKMIIHMMYEHRDDILLVLTKGQGSPMEGIVDKFIDTIEHHYKAMARQMEKLHPEKKLNENFIHWLAHEQVESFVYMITHIENEEQGISFMEQSITYMVSGWFGLFAKKD